MEVTWILIFRGGHRLVQGGAASGDLGEASQPAGFNRVNLRVLNIRTRYYRVGHLGGYVDALEGTVMP